MMYGSAARDDGDGGMAGSPRRLGMPHGRQRPGRGALESKGRMPVIKVQPAANSQLAAHLKTFF